MTARDREVLELLREDPELLAIADAVADTQRPPRQIRPRRAIAAVALTAAALFALVLASPWERGGGRGLVLERALAAIETRGPVVHAAIRFTQGFRVELATGKTTQPGIDVEVWYDKKQRLAHVIARRDGHVLTDQTLSAGPQDLSLALLFPIGLDAADFYRSALASGQAKVVGNGIWHGRPVYWLTVGDNRSLRVGIDRRTYRPVVFQGVDAEGRPTGQDIALVTLEYVPVSEAHFGKVSRDSLEGSSSGGVTSSDSPPLTPAKARLTLGVPAAWAGPRFSALPLTDISVEDADYQRDGGPKVRGKQLHLVYGRRALFAPGPDGIEIVELPAGSPLWESLAEGPPPSSGFADLTSSQVATSSTTERCTTRCSNNSHTTWTVTLAVAGVWASIDAPTRKLALAAARALRPIPPGRG